MITEKSLQPFLQSHEGNKIFSKVLQAVSDEIGLLIVLSRYIQFNSLFAGGVANLAGEVATRHDLFQDPNEPLKAIADRSVEIASAILYAAVDEFGDKATRHSAPHRTLAQATLKGVSGYLGLSASEFNRFTKPNPTTVETYRNIVDGYCINAELTDERIFTGLGFHMCSEIIAHYEFQVLIGFLQGRFAELVVYLEKTRTRVSDLDHESFYWIGVHTSVEIKHFENALRAANLGLRYYAGIEQPETVQSWIMQGVKQFLQIQTRFMEGLNE